MVGTPYVCYLQVPTYSLLPSPLPFSFFFLSARLPLHFSRGPHPLHIAAGTADQHQRNYQNSLLERETVFSLCSLNTSHVGTHTHRTPNKQHTHKDTHTDTHINNPPPHPHTRSFSTLLFVVRLDSLCNLAPSISAPSFVFLFLFSLLLLSRLSFVSFFPSIPFYPSHKHSTNSQKPSPSSPLPSSLPPSPPSLPSFLLLGLDLHLHPLHVKDVDLHRSLPPSLPPSLQFFLLLSLDLHLHPLHVKDVDLLVPPLLDRRQVPPVK